MSNIDRLLEMPASEYQVVDVIALRDAFHDKVEAIVGLRAELKALYAGQSAVIAELVRERDSLRAELDALRKQEPACVIDVDRHGNGVLVAGSLDRGIHKLYAAPVPPAAVAVPEGWRVNDDGHRITVCWDGIGYTLDDRHGLVQEAFCGFVRDVVKSAATPAPVAPKVVLGLGDAIELTKSYRDEFAETGETLLSNGQARRFADALTLVLYAVNGEK